MIKLEAVSKEIKKNEVIKNFTYEFEKGKCYLVTGHNGSGKTMLLRLICGLLTPTSGNITIKEKCNYGIMIENPSFIKYETGFYNLKSLADIKKTIDNETIREYLEKFNLGDVADNNVKTYSLGMRQRLGLAQAFMEDQNVILLDEPFNALDSENFNKVLELIEQEKEKGKLIIIASHTKLDMYENLFNVEIKLSDGNMLDVIEKKENTL